METTTTTAAAATGPRAPRRTVVVADSEERQELVHQGHDRLEELHRAEAARGDLRAGAHGSRVRVSTQLNLGDEKTALKALEGGDISAYPEYTGTALLSFFGFTADKLPSDEGEAFDEAKAGFAEKNLTALPPTPFVSSNEVAVTKETADKLKLKTISDLEGKSQDLTLYGSPSAASASTASSGSSRSTA